MSDTKKIIGYLRPDGRKGIRNYVLVIPASICATHVAERIAAQVEGAVSLQNHYGCAQLTPDLEISLRTLAGLGMNPNVASVLVIGLGCEGIQADALARRIIPSGKRVEKIVIQDCGGTLKAQQEGLRIVRELVQQAAAAERVEVSLADLVLGLECGGSDTTSGLAANPVIGYVSDKLAGAGGTAILSETTEMIGAEHLLAKRAVSDDVAKNFLGFVERVEKDASRMGVDMRGAQPSPGNIEGGLTTIEEKSLGCIHKGGHSPLQEAVLFAETPAKKGLIFMDTPGHDVESLVGMAAGGAQVMIFSTGRGTPTGNPIAPVIKITGNHETFSKMEDNIDINVSGIIAGDETVEAAGERAWREFIEVCAGKPTKAESLGHHEFGIYRIASSI